MIKIILCVFLILRNNMKKTFAEEPSELATIYYIRFEAFAKEKRIGYLKSKSVKVYYTIVP